MKVRVLGCSGTLAQACRTTAFLLDDNVLIDAGTGVGELTVAEMARIQHVLLTHSHLDHIAALPLMLDAVALQRLADGAPPLQVHALPETVASLQAHIFNHHIWPDFTRIPSTEAPLMRFEPLQVGQRLHAGGKTVEVLPAVHTVPAVGYAVAEAAAPADSAPRSHWVFTGDTGPNPALWQRLNQLPVAMLVIETTFSDQEKDLARRSLHLCPASLAAELDQINPAPPHPRYPIYITHTKPAETGVIMEQVLRLNAAPTTSPSPNASLNASPSSAQGLRHDIRWLSAGMRFEL